MLKVLIISVVLEINKLFVNEHPFLQFVVADDNFSKAEVKSSLKIRRKESLHSTWYIILAICKLTLTLLNCWLIWLFASDARYDDDDDG